MLEEIKKHTEYDVAITKQDHFGDGITKIGDKLVFVKHGLSGDQCRIVITNVKKTFAVAKIEKMFQPSSERVKPICPHYEGCGGCSLMHQAEEKQLSFKENKVRELFSRFAGISDFEIESISHGQLTHYRNKVVFHGLNGELGFYQEKSRDLTPIQQCLLVDEEIDQVYQRMRDYLMTYPDEEVLEVMIRKTSLKELMLAVKGKVNSEHLCSFFQDFPLASLLLNGEVISGKRYITEKIFDFQFRILSEAFFQVNYDMMLNLYQKVINYYRDKHYRKVLDLYSGTGTIGLLLTPYVEEVVGIEVVKDAVLAAKMNQEINQVKNISFIHGKVEDYIDEFEQIDSLVVDPPRSGLDSKTIATILKISPDSMVYISCDPVTLARDLKSLLSNYQLSHVHLVDMFPNTYHIETVVILEKRRDSLFDHYDVLVNRLHPYQAEDYLGIEMVKTKDINGQDVYVEKETYEHYLLFRTKLQELGIQVSISSGYRTLAEQQQIIDEFYSRYPEEKVAQKVAPVGTSEHHTGLALDITVRTQDDYLSNQLDSEKQKEYGEQYQIMETLCADYGFILRYPKDKEEVTGVNYEPWHFRYVGYPLSRKIMSQKLTLEEYLEENYIMEEIK